MHFVIITKCIITNGAIMKFYDRDDELFRLARYEELAQENFFFIRVTGRRRIGKTVLVREYLKRSDSPSLYFFVTKKKQKLLLDEYASIISGAFDEFSGVTFRDFDDFFTFLFKLMARQTVLVIFDEFQNFKYVDPAVFSILQKHIDLSKDQCRGLLMVIGSINSMMRRIFEDADQPLYGRLSGSFLLKNFPLSTIEEILEDHGVNDPDSLLFFYSIFEGIPFYYNYLSTRGAFKHTRQAVVAEEILDESAILLDEGKEILLEEFGKDYSTYFSILEAIASGATTMSRIADRSGMDVHHLGRYLGELKDSHELIERRLPFDASANSKMGRYFLKDNFLDFWFRYIFKNRSKISIFSPQRMAEEIVGDFPVYMGKKFETFIIRFLIEENQRGRGSITRIQPYWDRGHTEIDLVFTNDDAREINFGECKLSARKHNPAALEAKARAFLATNKKYLNWKKNLFFYSPGAQNYIHKTIPIE